MIGRVLYHHKAVSFMEGQQLLREAYDQTFGLFDHLGQAVAETRVIDPDRRRPLVSVAHLPAEDTSDTLQFAGTSFAEAAKQFMALEIHKHFGLDLVQYLELPSEYSRRLREMVQEHQAAAARISAAARQEVESAMGKPRPTS